MSYRMKTKPASMRVQKPKEVAERRTCGECAHFAQKGGFVMSCSLCPFYDRCAAIGLDASRPELCNVRQFADVLLKDR